MYIVKVLASCRKIILVVSDNNFTTFDTVISIWGESNLFWYQKLLFFARKNMLKTVCKFTKSVRKYGDARNKNYVLFLAI